jgi:hypothetical protein
MHQGERRANKRMRRRIRELDAQTCQAPLPFVGT